MKNFCLITMVLLCAASGCQTRQLAAPKKGVKPYALTCEYRIDPLGIDNPQPRLSWKLMSHERGQRQSAYQILVATAPEKLTPGRADLWDSGRIPSDRTTLLEYRGVPLASRTACYWKVRCWDMDQAPSPWSEPASWTMGLLRPGDWQAQWIGYDKNRPQWKDPNHTVLPPAVFLRKEFTAPKQVRRALVYASALGIYDLHLNGGKVGNDYFAPGWTDYDKRVYYRAYDVTGRVNPGDNVLGIILADGWYAGYVGFAGHKREHYGRFPRALAQLEIEYTGGSHQTVATGPDWQASYGPILEADFLMGEVYDARQELRSSLNYPERSGWDHPWCDTGKWDRVNVGAGKPVLLQAYPSDPVRVTQELKPVAITEPKPGVFIFDLGQNFAGIVRLRAKGQPGERITLRYGEILDANGGLFTKNLRSARATDTYICGGDGVETWSPRFTFHGFRYVEVSGYPGRPGPEAVTGLALNSDMKRTGEFACSNEMVNKLYCNLTWSQRSNYLEIPTDCPQRDERLGWTGDAQIFIRTGSYNYDIGPFFTKWLVDLRDGQHPEGGFPSVAPTRPLPEWGVNAWADAGVICPWVMYQVYGDKQLLADSYPSMVKWVEFQRKNSDKLIRPNKGYADWVAVGSSTPPTVVNTAYFAHSADLVARAARVLGRNTDARKYEQLFGMIRQAFTKNFVAPDGRIRGDSQTGYVLALAFELLPAEKRPQAIQYLIEDIQKHDNHLTTGFLGLSMLMPVLSTSGHTDTAYALLLQETFPGWLYSIRQGATTIWERWDSYTHEKGVNPSGMNSFNHYSFGAVGEWMFRTILGIDTDGPGFRRLIFRPQVGGDLTWARGHYDSISGPIESAWKITPIKGDQSRFDYRLSIPANTTAILYLPGKAASIREGGRPLAKAAGVKFLRQEGHTAVLEVASGDYAFTSEW